MSLTDYLAKHYLTADPTPGTKKSKKRKRKFTNASERGSSGLVIAEDDITGWNSGNSKQKDDDNININISGNTSEFRRTKKNNWTVVGSSAPSSADQAAADAILASAAAEQNAHKFAEEAEEAPLVLEGVENDKGGATSNMPRMESGARAGLQTAAQVAAAMAERAAEERRQLEALAKGDGAALAAAVGGETIYRDASGRIINVAMKRAEARRVAEEAVRKEAAELEAQKGDVQRAEKQRRKQDLEDAKIMPVARYADDQDLNDELKERHRWADPAAGFLTKTKKEVKSVTGKQLYQGAAPPNRYGIGPGHRWDGVDRGNGFEKEYFKARNRKKDLANLQYAWQTDE